MRNIGLETAANELVSVYEDTTLDIEGFGFADKEINQYNNPVVAVIEVHEPADGDEHEGYGKPGTGDISAPILVEEGSNLKTVYDEYTGGHSKAIRNYGEIESIEEFMHEYAKEADADLEISDYGYMNRCDVSRFGIKLFEIDYSDLENDIRIKGHDNENYEYDLDDYCDTKLRESIPNDVTCSGEAFDSLKYDFEQSIKNKAEEIDKGFNYYINVEDYQDTNWSVGRELTADGGRENALSGADSDEWPEEDIKLIQEMPEEELIDYISEVWTIRLVPADSDIAEEFKEGRYKSDYPGIYKG